MKWEIPKTKSLHSGQNAYRTGRHMSHPGAGQVTSTVVPLQRLKIQDDTLMEVPKSKLEAETPTTPPKIKQQCALC